MIGRSCPSGRTINTGKLDPRVGKPNTKKGEIAERRMYFEQKKVIEKAFERTSKELGLSKADYEDIMKENYIHTHKKMYGTSQANIQKNIDYYRWKFDQKRERMEKLGEPSIYE